MSVTGAGRALVGRLRRGSGGSSGLVEGAAAESEADARGGSEPDGAGDVERRLGAQAGAEGDEWARVEEALASATSHLSGALSRLAPFRDDQGSELEGAYLAVHEALGELAAVRHWRTLARIRQTGSEHSA